MHKRDFMGHNAAFWAKEFGHSDVLVVPGMPPPAAPIVEEVVTAFQYGHQSALASNPKAFALPSKTGAGGKKSKGAKGDKKKKKGK